MNTKNFHKNPKRTEISNLPDKESKEAIIKMPSKLESGLEELRELQQRIRKNNKNQADLNNTITGMKNIEKIQT